MYLWDAFGYTWSATLGCLSSRTGKIVNWIAPNNRGIGIVITRFFIGEFVNDRRSCWRPGTP